MFFLVGQAELRHQAVNMFADRDAKLRFLKIMHDIERNLAGYLTVVTIINAAVGGIVAVGAWLIGLPNPVIFGLLAAFLNYVPYVGPAVMVVIMFGVGLVSFPSLSHAFIAPLGFIAVTTMEGHFITPTIVGRRLTLNPLLVFLALAFWTWMWGPFGALLAAPLSIVGLGRFQSSGAGRRGETAGLKRGFSPLIFINGTFPNAGSLSGQSDLIPWSARMSSASTVSPEHARYDERRHREAREGVREASKAASDASGELQKDLQALRDDFGRLAEQMADILANRGGAAWQRARASVDDVVADAQDRGREAVGAVREVSDKFRRSARRVDQEPALYHARDRRRRWPFCSERRGVDRFGTGNRDRAGSSNAQQPDA